MWILPSYRRPEQCKQVVRRLIDKGCTTPGVLFVNGQDSEGYDEIPLPKGWFLHEHLENLGVCGALRLMFKTYPDEPFYGLICDDEFIETDEWDKTLIEAAGRWNLAHVNNGDTSLRWPHGFMTWGGDLVRAVGNLAPESMWHMFFDMYWNHLGRQCDLIKFCKDVHMKELHYTRGTASLDETNLAAQKYNQDDERWYSQWMIDVSENGAMATCRKIRKAIQSDRDVVKNLTALNIPRGQIEKVRQLEECYQRHFGGLQASEWRFIIRNFYVEIVKIATSS